MKDFCPNLEGVNTSNIPMTTFPGKAIKPDITYYNSPGSDSERAGIEKAELMVEAKFTEFDDPFKDVSIEGFLCDNDSLRARQT